MAGLVDRCEAWPLAMSLIVGCSLGRGAADALSDIDGALGVDAPPGEAGAATIATAEAMVVATLPELGALVDVLRHRTGPDREWAFHGWCALIDADKYLRRGSLWEAHGRLHEARHRIWALWAAAQGALYPWHGLSQVLDHDPGNLPPGIESTVAGLDAAGLRRAARASAEVLTTASEAAADRHPADLPTAMAAYVTRALCREP
jgi:hypothetical protein